MKKTLFPFLVLFFLSSTAFGAGDWQRILKQKKVCHTCEKKALLIGVGDYRNSGETLRDLKGPKNDIALIQEELVKSVLQYKSEEILVLMDHEATKANVTDIMENWFLKDGRVKERLFYFSGHGSQIDDDGGDENDGLDEVILTHDALFDSKGRLRPETVVADDHLRVWFERLKGKKLLAVFDSCHSGTMARSLGAPVATQRFVPSATRGRFGRSPEAKGRFGQKPGKKTALSEGAIPENHVYLYAAQSSQLALERPFGSGVHQGCFTTALVQTAKELCATARQDTSTNAVSYLELFIALNDVMKHNMNLEQTPDVQPVFRGERPEKYEGTDSARLLNPFFAISEDKTSVSLRTRLPDPDHHKISVLVTDASGKRMLGPRDMNHIAKYATLDFSKKDKYYTLYVNIDPNTVKLTNANGYLLNRFSYFQKSDLADRIGTRIQHAFLKDLLGQIESEQGLPMSVKVESGGRAYDKNDFHSGQEVTYVIQSNVDAYLYVLSVDAGGELNLYLPFEYQKNNKISKGGILRILDPKESGKDFVLEISQEPGEEILKIVASPVPLRIRLAEERDDYVSILTFEQALENIKDMIAQLEKQPVWYEGTRRYMNHTRADYDRMFR